MSLKIALILSVLLQSITAIIAITLIRSTKKNTGWWLISGGFLLMAIRRILELLTVTSQDGRMGMLLFNSWIGVLISVIMLFSLLFIRHIFNIQKRLDKLKKQQETVVFSAIIQTEEKERQNFAKELHDGLGPLLSSLKMAISVNGRNGKSDQPNKMMSHMKTLIDESVTSLREISNKLSPHVLNNFGLLKAVRSFIQKLNIVHGPKITINSNLDDARLPFNIEVVLYRVLCELLNNTLKHAGAHNVYIDLMKHENEISLQYIDDGVGFEPELTQTEKVSMGHSNIQSRVKSIGGSIDMFTAPGEGIRVNIHVDTGNYETVIDHSRR